MGRIARESGRLPAATHRALERFCARLENFIDQPQAPGLVHGDVWAGKVLCAAERLRAFLDPAVYFAGPEVEIAHNHPLSLFGPAFHLPFRERRNITPGSNVAPTDGYNTPH